jgi:hypothetical protein
MNGLRIGLAALGAFVAYFALGGLLFGALPAMRNEFRKFPSVYRPQEGQMAHMPAGMAAMFIAILALATLYATLNRGTSNVRSGAIFGALIGIYSVGSFVVHNYVNLNIGLKLTIQQGLAYFVQWLVVGL